MDYGFSGLNKKFNPKINNVKPNLDFNTPVRVTDIVLSQSHPLFKELGIGGIIYELVTSAGTKGKAIPLNISYKNFPLINEIVSISSQPNNKLGISNTNDIKYYTNPIALWNHPHHNAYPLISSTAYLGKTFIERNNIHPLLPFEGDIIVEGRWGNSIRLGSTVPNQPNNWSSIGDSGDPIIIIRNGQGSQTDDGYTPIIENINNIESTIFLSSTQNIPLKASSTSYVSYGEKPPTSIDKFSGKQIILNSGRLVFNANNDNILLSSFKSINLNSQESINIDTPKIIIQSDKIFLGKEDLATEPLMLGNATISLLKTLISSLQHLTMVMKTAQTSPAYMGPNAIPQSAPLSIPTINLEAVSLATTLEALNDQLNDIVSKRNFTV